MEEFIQRLKGSENYAFDKVLAHPETPLKTRLDT